MIYEILLDFFLKLSAFPQPVHEAISNYRMQIHVTLKKVLELRLVDFFNELLLEEVLGLLPLIHDFLEAFELASIKH